MLSSAYYRRQADVCLGMALAAQDERTAEEFRALALAFLTKASEAEGEDPTGGALTDPGDETSHDLRRG